MAIQVDPDRRLVLSFREVQDMTRWPDAMVVDYQGILQDLLDVVEQSNGESDDLQIQITANAVSIAKNEQILHSVAISTERAFGLIAALSRRSSNLEQLIYAW